MPHGVAAPAACIPRDRCAAIRARRDALAAAQQAVQDAEVELSHALLEVRRDFRLPIGAVIDLDTGAVTLPQAAPGVKSAGA